jgi:hypothetical protein
MHPALFYAAHASSTAHQHEAPRHHVERPERVKRTGSIAGRIAALVAGGGRVANSQPSASTH